jgi:putative methionine-R-sulfoxide reductase with GAF domain
MRADNPLILYEAKLSEVPSLLNLVRARETRVVNDMSIFASRNTTHSKQILGKGFLSSYTVPLFNEGEFIGVLFFNSYQRGAFDDSNLGYWT